MDVSFLFGADSLVIPVVSGGENAAKRAGPRRCAGPQSRCGGAGGPGVFPGEGGAGICPGCALILRQRGRRA